MIDYDLVKWKMLKIKYATLCKVQHEYLLSSRQHLTARPSLISEPRSSVREQQSSILLEQKQTLQSSRKEKI